MARVFGLWWGGRSYSHGYFYDDLESWPSLADAKASLIHRYESRWPDRSSVRVTFDPDDNAYVTLGDNDGSETPTVGQESYIDIYFGERGPLKDGKRLWRVYGEPSLRLSLSFYEREHEPGGPWREPELRGVKVERY